MTEIKLCKGDVCGSVKGNNNVIVALVAGIAIGAVAYAIYMNRNKGSLGAVLRYFNTFIFLKKGNCKEIYSYHNLTALSFFVPL